ncbi:hypothetical protein ACRALDRAFT_1033402 [Sodiomyces alcalophilus JCM 7366]|uniref:uncharacterized protein n=1 Tax=Sodiomyces alcalophilus JCM 7366 TaxID=591952 RepID=UPI0039B37964
MGTVETGLDADPGHPEHSCHEPPKTTRPGFIGAIEQRSNLTRFVIYDIATAEPVASHTAYWHEIDAAEIVTTVQTCIEGAYWDFVAQGFEKDDIKAIGIASQRETTVVWDVSTGEPLYKAIASDDTRTTQLVAQCKEKYMATIVPDLTGMPISNSCSALKLMWLIDNVPEVEDARENGNLAFGTVDSWLVYHLNGRGFDPGGRPVHVTDSTNAARTLLMNLRNLHYEPGILHLLAIDTADVHLPRIVASSDPHAFGVVYGEPLSGIRITGCLADDNAVLVGQGAFQPGEAKATYHDGDGNGGSVLCNVGKEKPMVRDWTLGLRATVAYDFETTGDFRFANYALEAPACAVTPVMGPLIHNLGLAGDGRILDKFAREAEDSGVVTYVAGFDGLPDPDGTCHATGSILGLSHDTTQGQIALALLETTCFHTRAILRCMAHKSDHPLDYLAADGELANSDICMQIQADTLGLAVDRSPREDTAALGAAFAAGIGIGVWDVNDLLALRSRRQTKGDLFLPNLEPEHQQHLDGKMRKWKSAVRLSRAWLQRSPNGEPNEYLSTSSSVPSSWLADDSTSAGNGNANEEKAVILSSVEKDEETQNGTDSVG